MKNTLKLILPTFFLLLFCACTKKPEMTLCKEPRPLQCTEAYEPVCAKTKSGVMENRSSACAACSDFDVVGTFSGQCTDEMKK